MMLSVVVLFLDFLAKVTPTFTLFPVLAMLLFHLVHLDTILRNRSKVAHLTLEWFLVTLNVVFYELVSTFNIHATIWT